MHMPAVCGPFGTKKLAEHLQRCMCYDFCIATQLYLTSSYRELGRIVIYPVLKIDQCSTSEPVYAHMNE